MATVNDRTVTVLLGCPSSVRSSRGGVWRLSVGPPSNSLVALPLALALPDALATAPLAVATQTLVELIAMVALVRLVPAIVPSTTAVP